MLTISLVSFIALIILCSGLCLSILKVSQRSLDYGQPLNDFFGMFSAILNSDLSFLLFVPFESAMFPGCREYRSQCEIIGHS